MALHRSIPPKEKITHDRLAMVKVEHFMDFLFKTGTLQDVAYGTTTLKQSWGGGT